MKLKRLKGDWKDDSGIIQGAGEVLVNVCDDGAIRCAETNTPLIVTTEKESWGEITEITNGVWVLSLDSGEMERIGL